MLKKIIKELAALDNPDEAASDARVRNLDVDLDSTDSSSAEVNTARPMLPLAASSDPACPSSVLESVDVKPSQKKPNSKDMNKSPGEIAFFKMLHSEFKKCVHFFTRAELEFSIRQERVKEAMAYMSQPGALMVQDRWSQLAKALYRFYKDLLLLENYAIMSYCSFSKILKKHDKNTGFSTRQAFMANVVNTANFAKYEKVMSMITSTHGLFNEVAVKLQEEGTGDLHRDERLFIDMIHRLNRQASEMQEDERRDIQEADHVNQAEKVRALEHALDGTDRSAVIKSKLELVKDLVEENEAAKAAKNANGGDKVGLVEGRTKRKKARVG